MKNILFACFFVVSFAANSVEIIIEENGNRRIIKVPDNQKQDVILKINTTNSTKNKNNNIKCAPILPIKKNVHKKPKTIIAKKPYKPVIKNIEKVKLVNIYHYFYPCSLNPQMSDCVRDNDIKIDEKTRRMVVQKDDKFYPVDMIDRKTKIISDSNKFDQGFVLPEHKKIAPIFDSKNYSLQSIPTNDKYVEIDTQYGKKNMTVIR